MPIGSKYKLYVVPEVGPSEGFRLVYNRECITTYTALDK